MSRNGSGTYSLPAGNPVVTGTTISSSWANNTMNDIANALSGSIAADGQTPITANLNLNNNKLINVANPTNAQDATTKSYVDAVAFTVAPGANGNVLTSNGSAWTSAAIPSQGFDAGTLMLFQQTSAPTGWTKQTTHDNKALRVVSGTASSGGTTAFTSVFTNQTPTITTSGLSAGATTLSTAQIPSHTHNTTSNGNNWGIIACGGANNGLSVNSNPLQSQGTGTGSAGSGGSHTHSISGSATSSAITLNVQYVDLIIASKN